MIHIHDIEKPLEMQSRRVKRVGIDAMGLLHLLKTREPHMISCRGIPEGAKVLRFAIDSMTNVVWLLVEHESFTECAEGRIPDDLEVSFSSYYGERVIEEIQKQIRETKANG